MGEELADLRVFLQSIPPFDSLPLDRIDEVIKAVDICYLRCGETLPPRDIVDPKLYLLRSGSLNYSDDEGELLGKYAEAEICSLFCQACAVEGAVSADEDCLLYAIDYQSVQEALRGYPQVLSFFSATSQQRLQQQVTLQQDEARINASLMDQTIEGLYKGPAATVAPGCSIRQAAQQMTALSYSSLLVVEGDELLGIVTDKDIRQRCVAEGVDTNSAVAEIMTSNVKTISCDQNAFDALILMNSKGIHHLPVTRSAELVGMISATDLMNKEGQNAVHLTAMIKRAQDLQALVDIGELVPALQQRMSKMGVSARHIGRQITAITNGITVRLIELAIEAFGEPPVAFALVVAGSQARHEQCCHTDQDNALIYADDASDEACNWLEKLAHFVCDGLAACGYIYCPGDIMATNAQWRQPQREWRRYFTDWVQRPTPQALLNSSVFFDLSTVYGDETLLQEVRRELLEMTKANTLLESHLSRNALQMRPPLGFFRDFVLVSKGEHKDSLDLKHSGIAPIVELARIYALALGIDAVNTVARLEAAAASSILTQASADSLIDAFEFLCNLRLQHQSRQMAQGEAPNNFLPPKEISKLEREHLKDAFKVIKTLQDVRNKGL